MYLRSNNINIVGIELFGIIKELIGSIIVRFNDGLEESIMDYFVPDNTGAPCYRFHEIGLKSSG